MKKEKLNLNWEALAFDVALKAETDLRFQLTLNSEGFEHIDQGELAFLNFTNVHVYAISNIAKEEYLNGAYRLKEQQIPWGQFYEVSKSNWKSEFPKQK
jgi:hypothetical protein